ncbi:MAG: TraR/DksA C4-type zinc finger protein [Pseudomonadota bacterium]
MQQSTRLSPNRRTDPAAPKEDAALNLKPLGHYKSKLEARLRELNERLGKIETSLDQPGNKNIEDQATERENDEVLESLGDAGLTEIRMIQAAMRRIEDGSYGECVQCGEQISADRLELLPHAPRCRYCA